MNKTIQTNYNLIEFLSKKKLIRTYSYFLKFKYLHVSSCVIKGNRLYLSRALNISEKNVRIQINKMLKLGWIKMSGKNFVFISKNEMYKMYDLKRNLMTFKCRIEIDLNESISNIITKLHSKTIELCLKKQQFLLDIKDKALYSNKTSNGEIQWKGDKVFFLKRRRIIAKKRRSLTHVRYEARYRNERETSLSSLGFAKFLNTSVASANRLKKSMSNLSLIEVKQRYDVVRENVSTAVKKRFIVAKQLGNVPSNMLIMGNNIVVRRCDVIKMVIC